MCNGKMRIARCGLAVLLLAGACATKPYDPYRIPVAELRARVHVIALAPIQALATVADREDARTKIEPLVTARLVAGGFQVVPSTEMEQRWRAAAADVGNVFDPVTGKIDQVRHDAVEAAVYHELRTERNVDAVLWIVISTVELYQVGPNAAFCGVDESTYWPGGVISRLQPATLVLGSCLSAQLYDMEERELYNIRSGLETVETFAWQTHAVRPLDERLRNASRLQQAVDATVGPLADRVAGR
jgi:hypothetical protein